MQMKIEEFDENLGGKFKKYHEDTKEILNGRNQFSNIGTSELMSGVDVPYDAIDYIRSLYESGYGLKVLARSLGMTYTSLRRAFFKTNIEIKKGNKVHYDKTREFRSDKAKDINPLRDWVALHPEWAVMSRTGIGGKYLKADGSYIWLRSSWEYAYAKWLDSQGVSWGFEERQFHLSDGTQYRPDFFIYENGKLVRVVEIKGYWDNRAYKCDLLSNEYNIEVVRIDSVMPYFDGSYRKLLREWKSYIEMNNEVDNVN